MPYTPPAAPAAVAARARNHRRSASFTDEAGPGAFVSLGALPKVVRKPKSKPAFHFRNDDDDDSPEDEPAPPPAPLSVDTAPVPFPLSSPNGSGSSTPQLTADTPSPGGTRPALTRGASQPVLLSNGKPLKSSLKSSASAPALPPDLRSLHLRAQSAPSTPFLAGKNVHFPEKREDGLEDVRVFSRKARPASVSLPPGMGLGDDTETETEQESAARFPFPRFTAAPPQTQPAKGPLRFKINAGASSAIPAAHPPGDAHIHLESLALSHTPPTPGAAAQGKPGPPQLSGTLLVRNIAYEKAVAVRFTLDEWQTTSEVRAAYVASLPALPWAAQPQTLGDAVSAIAGEGTAWDRFGFTIRLEDHAYRLHERVLWMVGRYGTGGGAEWWDNNNGANYRVAFKAVEEPKPAPPPPVVAPTSKRAMDFGLGFDFPAPAPAAPQVSASAFIPPIPPFNTYNSSASSSSTGSFTARRGHGLNLLNYAAPSSSSTPSAGTTPTGLPVIKTTFASPTDKQSHSPPKRSPVASPSLATAGSNSNPFFAKTRRVSPPRSPTKEGRKPEGTVPGWNWTASAALAQRALLTGTDDEEDGPGTPLAHSTGNVGGRAQGTGANFAWGAPRALGVGAGYHSPTRRSPPGTPQRVLSPFSPSGATAVGFGGLMGGMEMAGGGDSSDELYKAFVKQWCFASTPSVGPAAAGPAGGAAAEVLVG
ncbi:hypothetical protein HWV62_7310 [Athelia sp. TMB]|nr:hypothetical protein HWV62_7310 [Athelia sp. TMB]